MKLYEQVEVKIIHNTALGDGVGEYEGLPIYVPYSMADEIVRVEINQITSSLLKGRLLEIISESPHRNIPACEYFGKCGGCSLQHLSPNDYRQLKTNNALKILKELHQPEDLMQPIIEIGAKERRRITLSVRVHKGEIILGYSSAKSHDIIGIESCPVIVPILNALLKPLKECVQQMKKPSIIMGISLTLASNGIDMLVRSKAPLKSNDCELLQKFAVQNNVIRAASQINDNINYQMIYFNCEPLVRFGELTVAIPVGAFLQASEKAESVISAMVKVHLADCTNVVDIYSGCGTYSFPLHETADYISAYEGSAEMVAAIHNACLLNNLDHKIIATNRNLYALPLTKSELQQFDGAIINPPRNGASPQIKQLAASNISKVVMISCNPSTFSRDAAILLASGYQLQSLTPIDQFVWSSHLEIVGLFVRA
jgi:23S rRNA (uracil1939-C5)-methyltransferase